MITVIVRNNDSLERALRILDLKCRKARVLQIVKEKSHYISPSEKRHRKKLRRFKQI